MSKKALITGINGQDGSYLAELLLEKGYEVHGVDQKSLVENPEKLTNLKHIINEIKLYPCNVADHLSVYKLILNIKPQECYHLAASSFVSYSFDDDSSILSNNFNSTHYLLSSIKEIVPDCRFYFAGSSEMFGEADFSPQNESTRFNPRSVYGISKVSSHFLVKNYRSSYGIFACTGITYNHESPRRGGVFVTKKITSSIPRILKGELDKLTMGYLDAKRDWGYAKDYVEAMWLMLQQDEPDDFVIATGEVYSVREFLEESFKYAGLNWENYVEIDSKYFRPSETVPLVGDITKAEQKLGWKPKTKFNELVKMMVEADLKEYGICVDSVGEMCLNKHKSVIKKS